MKEPIWASGFLYWLLIGDVSRSCLHSSRTRRVRTLKVSMTVILWVYEFWCTEVSSESRIWSRTWRGVSKWSRHKDWYIGRLYSDTGSVPGKFRDFSGVPRGYRNPPVTPRYSKKYPKHSGTIPVSEHGRPLLRSLCLDHFETPRHVRNHIRDSEQPSVHQNA